MTKTYDFYMRGHEFETYKVKKSSLINRSLKKTSKLDIHLLFQKNYNKGN